VESDPPERCSRYWVRARTCPPTPVSVGGDHDRAIVLIPVTVAESEWGAVGRDIDCSSAKAAFVAYSPYLRPERKQGEGLRVEGKQGEGLRVEGKQGEGLRVEGKQGEGLRVEGKQGEGLRVEGKQGEGLRVEGKQGEGLRVEAIAPLFAKAATAGIQP
jgi:hypothetical protein